MVLTDFAMFPALSVMFNKKRHFELFIGTFHFFISFCFNIAGALDQQVFLTELEWHFIADVLSLTYALMLFVHFMGFTNEKINIVLRYLAFALSWLTKVRDKWDSTIFQVLLVFIYALIVLYRQISPYVLSEQRKNKIPLRMKHVFPLCQYLVALLLCFAISLTEFAQNDPFNIIYGLYHIAGGMAFYHAWLSVPVRDVSKKQDIYLPQTQFI